MENLKSNLIEKLILGIAGVFSFLFYKLCIDKIIKWDSLKKEILKTTVEFGHFYSIVIDTEDGPELTTKEKYDSIQEKLRSLAGEVETIEDIVLFNTWVKLKFLPQKKSLDKIKGCLIGWSNSLVKEDWNSTDRRAMFIEEIKKYLNKENSYEELREIQRIENRNRRR